jgi:hypothetical protein
MQQIVKRILKYSCDTCNVKATNRGMFFDKDRAIYIDISGGLSK